MLSSFNRLEMMKLIWKHPYLVRFKFVQSLWKECRGGSRKFEVHGTAIKFLEYDFLKLRTSDFRSMALTLKLYNQNNIVSHVRLVLVKIDNFVFLGKCIIFKLKASISERGYLFHQSTVLHHTLGDSSSTAVVQPSYFSNVYELLINRYVVL